MSYGYGPGGVEPPLSQDGTIDTIYYAGTNHDRTIGHILIKKN